MSILINGMEMPKCCSKCDLRVIEIGLDFQCAISGETVDDYYSSRHPKCPIVKVPTPHGRLIDADYINGSGLIEWQKSIVKAEISQAPTVVEAEVSDNA